MKELTMTQQVAEYERKLGRRLTPDEFRLIGRITLLENSYSTKKTHYSESENNQNGRD